MHRINCDSAASIWLVVQYFRYRYDELKFNSILHINVLIIRYFNRNTINFVFGHDITTLIMAIFEKVDYIEIELAPIIKDYADISVRQREDFMCNKIMLH